MSDDENQKAAELVPRSWRNHHRSRRAHELRRDMAAVDESLVVSEWWEESSADPDQASTGD
ncbi:hypothetical protein J2X60_002971 [Curtobacterium sp. 320]|uniref:hypothetical protein n=1 Tax=Curtobacterium sp. 320 TaxID=2817749 RepID=UPI0028592C1C|nr:hypothetical protein [Curtobacterium sp. 320]MDR6574312.1 hypothetical protein [Curtobacterium sp. 320]